MGEQVKVKECPYCAEEIKPGAVICKHCRSNLSEEEVLQPESSSMLSFGWIFGTIFLPIVGIIGWIYGLINGRRGAWGLLGISIALWIIYALLLGQLILNNAQMRSLLQLPTTSRVTSNNTMDSTKEVLPATWVTIAEWQGEGMRSTESFLTQSREWRINWRTYDEPFENAGILQIFVYDANTDDIFIDLVANVQGPSEANSYVRTPPGEYYLEIISANIKWEITIEEKR